MNAEQVLNAAFRALLVMEFGEKALVHVANEEWAHGEAAAWLKSLCDGFTLSWSRDYSTGKYYPCLR